METAEIVNSLYNQYYLEYGTPEQFVASHWKHYQSQLRVRIENGNIKSLAGVGFGDLEQNSVVNQAFSLLTIGSYLISLPHRREIRQLIKPSIALAKGMGLGFTYDCFRQMCALELIKRYIKKESLNIIIIGDGYGFLASLIKEIYPNSHILLVDLGKILLFQAYYCGKAHPKLSHHLVTDLKHFSETELCYDFIYCPVEHLEAKCKNLSFDLAINIASMQEMNKYTIGSYFNYLRSHLVPGNLFYCCNREKKELLGGEVVEFLGYPWSESDIHLIDEYCGFYRYFLSSYNAGNGPKLLGFRIPFINYFDGAIRHRLSVLDVERDVKKKVAKKNA